MEPVILVSCSVNVVSCKSMPKRELLIYSTHLHVYDCYACAISASGKSGSSSISRFLLYLKPNREFNKRLLL